VVEFPISQQCEMEKALPIFCRFVKQKGATTNFATEESILPLVKYILQTTSVDRYHRTEYLDTDFVTQEGKTALDSSRWHTIISCPDEAASSRAVLPSCVTKSVSKYS
jgi:hypothetical protein